MKILLKFSCFVIIVVFVLSVASPAVLAGTVKRNYKTNPTPPPNDDYNPDADPLPEWLILPEGVDENQLEFRGNVNSQQSIINRQGAAKWTIVSKNNGKSITYRYYESNKLMFGAKTTSNYLKVTLYDSNRKKLKTMTGEDFFNDDISVGNAKDVSKGVKVVNTKLAVDGCPGKQVRKDARTCVSPDYNKVRKNKKLTKRQLKKLAHKAGFRGEGRKIAVAVSQAESRGRIGEVLCNTKNPYNPRHKFERGVKACSGDNASADRGLWQINNRWHKNVSNKCAFNSKCNAKKAYKISNGGRDWTPWSTYENKLYLQYL